MSIASKFSVKLSGVTFVEGYPDVLYRLQARLEMPSLLAAGPPDGLPATLVRDADNEFDPNAVAVHVADVGHIGHIPREVAARLAPDIDAGETWTAEVTEVLIHDLRPDQPGISVRCARSAP